MRLKLFTIMILLGVSLVACSSTSNKAEEPITKDEVVTNSKLVNKDFTKESNSVSSNDSKISSLKVREEGVKSTQENSMSDNSIELEVTKESSVSLSDNSAVETQEKVTNDILEITKESSISLSDNSIVEAQEKSNTEFKSSSFPFGADRGISQPYLNRTAGKLFILDADLNTDVDDVCAVRMATALDDLGVIDLKGVMYCVDNSSYGALRGILHHDGKDDVLMGQGTEDRHEGSPYWNELGKHNDFGGDWGDAVRQYRRILAEATSPVDIVTTGMLTNLEALLKSQPDDISPLTGKELVWQKVGQLYVTGGDHPTGWSNNLALTEAATIATKYVSQNWGLPIIWSPGNYTGYLMCGGYLQELDVARKDPVSRALDAWGVSKGRSAWDPFAVWVAGYGVGEVNQVELRRVTFGIQDGGANWFVDGEGKDFIIKPTNPDDNYYNQTMDNHLIHIYTKIYGVENPNKEPIGLSVLK